MAALAPLALTSGPAPAAMAHKRRYRFPVGVWTAGCHPRDNKKTHQERARPFLPTLVCPVVGCFNNSPYAKRGLGRACLPKPRFAPPGAGVARAWWSKERFLEGLQPSKA